MDFQYDWTIAGSKYYPRSDLSQKKIDNEKGDSIYSILIEHCQDSSLH